MPTYLLFWCWREASLQGPTDHFTLFKWVVTSPKKESDNDINDRQAVNRLPLSLLDFLVDWVVIVIMFLRPTLLARRAAAVASCRLLPLHKTTLSARKHKRMCTGDIQTTNDFLRSLGNTDSRGGLRRQWCRCLLALLFQHPCYRKRTSTRQLKNAYSNHSTRVLLKYISGRTMNQ